MGRQAFGTHMVYWEKFLQIQRRLLQVPNATEHISPHVTSERQIPDTALDPRCQSGPSARNSVVPSEGGFSKDYGADQQSPYSSNVRLLEDKIQD